MKVTFLLVDDRVDEMSASVLTHAGSLKDRLEVDVLIAVRAREEPIPEDPRIGYKYLVDVRGEPRPVRVDVGADRGVFTLLSESPGQLIDSDIEGQFNRLTEVEVEIAFRLLETDILVTTTPALLALATQLVPSHVHVVHLEQAPTAPPTEEETQSLLTYGRRASAIVFSAEQTRRWYGGAFGDSAPLLELIPDGGPNGSGSADLWVDLFGRVLGGGGLVGSVYRAALGDLDRSVPLGVGEGVVGSEGVVDEVEASLLRRFDGLRKFRDRLWHPLGGRSLLDVKLDDLEMVGGVLDGCGLPWVYARDVTTSTGGTAVVVGEERRGEVMGALRDGLGGSAAYVSVPQGTRWLLAGELEESDEEWSSSVVRVNRFYANEDRSQQLGPGHGCLILFAQPSEDLAGHVTLPMPTIVGDTFPVAELEKVVSIQVRDRSYPSIEAFQVRTVDDFDFPIDAVYMWVDGSDPVWQERMRKTRHELGLDQAVDDTSRFRSRDELRYSLRSLEMFAPWIRHVYLVTDQQRPDWLVDNPKLTLVDHRDIIPTQHLPTFNSHVIGARLHHIDGLAEHYLVMNDDVFFGRPIERNVFFLTNGIARHFRSSARIPFGPRGDDDPAYLGAWRTTRELFYNRFGLHFSRSFIHAPIPQLKSIHFEFEELFPTDHARTVASRFRSPDDIEFAGILHHYYAHHVGRSVPSGLRYNYVNIGIAESERQLTGLLSTRHVDALCLNDNQIDGVEPVSDEWLDAFMSAYFGIPSQFES